MTLNALTKHLFSSYSEYKLTHLVPANCNHGQIVSELHELTEQSGKLFAMKEVGTSLEGRSINLLTCGSGQKKVLLWSQMHGDEPTATLALMDMLSFLLHRNSDETWVQEMLEETTLYIIPMMNPDGAERKQRRTAQGIDMNRDARTLMTPEAKLLRQIQQRYKPAFGFNLHDQELAAVGNSNRVTAMALLAPALDGRETTPKTRLRAMRVAAAIARSLAHFIEGHLAMYDDAFEPRAFGDNMQGWGTSTVLIESGHWPKDREKSFIRKLNYVAILGALRAISDGSYQDVDMDHYLHLPPNGKGVFDILIRNVVLEHPRGWSHSVDLGLLIEPIHNKGGKSPVVTIKDIGDLSTVAALEIIAGNERKVTSSTVYCERVLPLDHLMNELQLYHPVT